MAFKENIRLNRKRLNLSQDGLARLLNVHENSVARWESGERIPRVDALIAMAKLFGITETELIHAHEDEEGTNHNVP